MRPASNLTTERTSLKPHHCVAIGPYKQRQKCRAFAKISLVAVCLVNFRWRQSLNP